MTDGSDLIARLAAHRTVGKVPDSELGWLVEHGTLEHLPQGAVLTSSGGAVRGLYIVLSGRLSLSVPREAGPRTVMEWQGGDVTGMLPYSRMKAPPADVVADAPTEVLFVDRACLAEMIQKCQELTAVMVHVMVDRARVFTSSELLDEKMRSLGRLAAGLAHELNNPASAVARGAASLSAALGDLDVATQQFCGLNLPDASCEAVSQLRRKLVAQKGARLGTIELADRQDEIADWLSGRVPAEAADALAEPLAEAGVTTEALETLAAVVTDDQLTAALHYVATDGAVRRLATDIDTAASRIHTLVAAVKGFTHMDQTGIPLPVDVGQGLSDTLTVLRSKAKGKSIELDLVLEPRLPCVPGYGGELNQVWANLLDNAIDASPSGSSVTIAATREADHVVVRVADRGPGIPESIRERIFDPFFTTKAVGSGTGLGLDIARRIVMRHRGDITVRSSAAGTEFVVRLPVPAAATPSP